MSDVMLSMDIFEGANWLAGAPEAKPESTLLNGSTFYDYYKTRDDRWISVSSLEPKFFAALLDAMELPATLLQITLDDPEAQTYLKKILQEKFLERPWPEWEAAFADIDACVELVLEFPEAMEHQHFKAREMIAEVPTLDGSAQKQIASPFKFSICKAEYRHVDAELGEQTEMVLKDLRYTEQQIEKLKYRRLCRQ